MNRQIKAIAVFIATFIIGIVITMLIMQRTDYRLILFLATICLVMLPGLFLYQKINKKIIAGAVFVVSCILAVITHNLGVRVAENNQIILKAIKSYYEIPIVVSFLYFDIFAVIYLKYIQQKTEENIDQ